MADTKGNDAQKFSGANADKSSDLVAQIRVLLDGKPIAIAHSAIAIIHDDIRAQLQFKRSEF